LDIDTRAKLVAGIAIPALVVIWWAARRYERTHLLDDDAAGPREATPWDTAIGDAAGERQQRDPTDPL
jgi:hypothetical protein